MQPLYLQIIEIPYLAFLVMQIIYLEALFYKFLSDLINILYYMHHLLVKIIQQLFSKAFSGEMLRGLDRSLGLLFGLVEGVVVVAFIILVMISQPWVDFRSALDGSFFDKILSSVIAQPAAYIKGMAA